MNKPVVVFYTLTTSSLNEQAGGGVLYSATSSLNEQAGGGVLYSATSSLNSSQSGGDSFREQNIEQSLEEIYGRGFLDGIDSLAESDALYEDDFHDDDYEESYEYYDENAESSEMTGGQNRNSSSTNSTTSSTNSTSSSSINNNTTFEHSNSSTINSSDLIKIKKHLDSDVYISASNSSNDRININEFYSTDSNTYKGTDSGSEYFKMMKHRDRLRN